MQQHLLTLALSHILLTPPFQPQVSCFVRARSDRDLERGAEKSLAVSQWSEGLAKVPSGIKILCLCVSVFLVMKQMGIC